MISRSSDDREIFQGVCFVISLEYEVWLEDVTGLVNAFSAGNKTGISLGPHCPSVFVQLTCSVGAKT